MEIELYIENNGTLYAPVLGEEITWTTDCQGVAGELNFSVVKDSIINFQEGNPVVLKVDGINVFYGFVFTKKRTKDITIDVTAYDQLRYLKNKYPYVYENKTATEVIKFIAEDFMLNVGDLEETSYKIPSRVEDNTTLFDIIQTALDLTLMSTKEMYILFDDFGKLTLKNISSMIIPVVIDEETGENFDYSSSIDGETYNQIKLVYANEETGKYEVYITKDSNNINSWGLLQYFDTIDENENGKVKADALLELYNSKTRTLSVSNCFGDLRVRAGCMVIIQLNLGDMILNNLMLVEKCKHIFKDGEHFMDLTFKGGEFIG